MALKLVPKTGEPGDDGRSVDALAMLSAGAARGDAPAIQSLVLSITPAMLRAVRGVLAPGHPDTEDVLHEAVIGFIRALPSFRQECTVLHFACRIAVHIALAARRRANALGSAHYELVEESCGSEEWSPADQVMSARRRKVLRKLCDELPPLQSEALLLHCVLGYTVEEVADATQVPANTVRSRLRLAKEALRARVSADPSLREALETFS